MVAAVAAVAMAMDTIYWYAFYFLLLGGTYMYELVHHHTNGMMYNVYIHVLIIGTRHFFLHVRAYRFRNL